MNKERPAPKFNCVNIFGDLGLSVCVEREIETETQTQR